MIILEKPRDGFQDAKRLLPGEILSQNRADMVQVYGPLSCEIGPYSMCTGSGPVADLSRLSCCITALKQSSGDTSSFSARMTTILALRRGKH
ncbi:hypothetical protein E4U43_002936, partial [Claviceps pusilla]